ncbi:hypothetical protein Q5741_05750 [Paenibacillus sp. JX-17]|uniref:Uncharacterized protein n=1 Tax=Paenibacillus lacisoli TaxID=3064525 RepID=A0ABT9CDZ6_9BACL|nr:hypothetical protein [Paenibacillus sp. JX-17]MDO7905921.1 hypothetical protein [Paenibacillus sp. JX-17]
MRTANQIQAKINEFTVQRNKLQASLQSDDISTEENERLSRQMAVLDEKIMLLEWVIFSPDGKYHL